MSLLYVTSSNIMIFKERCNKNMRYLIEFFDKIGEVTILEPDFTEESFYQKTQEKNIFLYVLPGGSSNISDKDTQYWKYVNLTMKSDIPKVALCLGFQHVLKYLTSVLITRCDMYRTIYNNEYHNHKWCVKKEVLERKLEGTNILFNFKEYISIQDSFEFLNRFKYKNILGYAFHPEVSFNLDQRKGIDILCQIKRILTQRYLIDTSRTHS